MKNKEKCCCSLCTRTRDYNYYLNKIQDQETAEWFKDFYGHVCMLEEDLESYKIYNDNLKTLYPKIWKETNTIETLHKDDAKYPERQL